MNHYLSHNNVMYLNLEQKFTSTNTQIALILKLNTKMG